MYIYVSHKTIIIDNKEENNRYLDKILQVKYGN